MSLIAISKSLLLLSLIVADVGLRHSRIVQSIKPQQLLATGGTGKFFVLIFSIIAWLQAKRSISGVTEDILRNDIRISQLDVEKIKLITDRENLLAEKNSILQKSEIELRLAISLWKRKYVIFSPISGKLIWETNLAPGKYLVGGKPIGTVIPEGKKQKIIAICLTPVSGSGRIKKGNIVKIELDAFPFEEYGRIEANVIAISPLPLSDRNDQYFYQVMASLPCPLPLSRNR